MENIHILFLFLVNFFIKIKISHSECDRDTPIKTNGGCELKFCTKNQFERGECSIDNKIIEKQWLNNIILFDFDKLRYGSFAINSKGDLAFECSIEEGINTEATKGTRVFYWLKKDGSFYFENENGEKTSTKTISLEKINDKIPIRFESLIKFVSTNNNNGEYLISFPIYICSVEYYDFANNIRSMVSSPDMTKHDIHSTVNSLLEYNNNGNKEYLYTFIGRQASNTGYNDFRIVLQRYSFTGNRIGINNGNQYGYNYEEKVLRYLETMRPRCI